MTARPIIVASHRVHLTSCAIATPPLLAIYPGSYTVIVAKKTGHQAGGSGQADGGVLVVQVQNVVVAGQAGAQARIAQYPPRPLFTALRNVDFTAATAVVRSVDYRE